MGRSICGSRLAPRRAVRAPPAQWVRLAMCPCQASRFQRAWMARATAPGGGLDDTTARTRIDLSRAPAGVSPQTLTADFVRQMTAAGWKVEAGPTTDQVMSRARMSHRSRAGGRFGDGHEHGHGLVGHALCRRDHQGGQE